MRDLEPVKCPCCGNLPELYDWDHGYCWYRCIHPSCNFRYAIVAEDKVNAIKLWNAAVLKYKEDNYG